MNYRLLPVGLSVLLLAACQAPAEAPVEPPVAEQKQIQDPTSVTLLRPDGTGIDIAIELADTPEEQQRGLMAREELPEGTGMLFVFPQEQKLNFWMKNTLIPLDILYFRSDYTLISTATMTPCEADPCSTYPSLGPAQYALEVPAGFVEEQQVGNGWRLVVR